VALVAPHYHVGSFDDDASYILSAQTLLHGHGLTGRLASGQTVVGLYPPGYPALLVPLVWLWPHSFLPLRLLSVACYAAAFPLTWVFLDRRRVAGGVRVAALTVLALGPPFATFGSMVMAEGPFLVALLVLLLALDRWHEQARTFTAAGAVTIVSAAGLVWLKQAGIALVGGLILWTLLKRWRHGLALAAGVGLSLLPVVVARLSSGVPLAGSRYSTDLGGFYQGGVLSRLHHVLPAATWHMFSTAIPATLIPYLEPLPIRGHWPDLWKVVSWHVSVLALIGAVRWWRRYRDATAAMILLYLVESVLWPYVNERRAILFLPLLVVWYVMGAVAVWQAGRWLGARVRPGLAPRWPVAARAGAAALVTAFVLVPLVAQAPRDYLFGWGQSSSNFGGSRYASLLAHLGRPSDVVESDYQSSTALFTGHATNWTAFGDTPWGLCYAPLIQTAVRQDDAGFMLVGDVNKPGVIDDACLAAVAEASTWSVPLLHTSRDNASVFELIGPGTGHPDVTNVLAGAMESLGTDGTTYTAEWDFGPASQLSQVSVGEAAAPAGVTTSVGIELRRADGSWFTVNRTDRRIGDGAGAVPYVLDSFSPPVTATAMRIVVVGTEAAGPGSDPGPLMGEPAALGPAVGAAAAP
jgi:hypothetical protein